MTWGFPYTANPIADSEPANAPRWWSRFLSPCNAMLANLGDTNWLSPGYVNSWADYGGGYALGGYRLLNNEVWIQGLVKAGTGSAIFTLPSGYRPGAGVIFDQICDGPSGTQNGGCRITVSSVGTVSLSNYFASGDNAYVSLTGIHFAQVN